MGAVAAQLLQYGLRLMAGAHTGGFGCRGVPEVVLWGEEGKILMAAKSQSESRMWLCRGVCGGGNNGTRFTLHEKLKPVPPSGQLIIPRYGESTVSCNLLQRHARARLPLLLRAKHGAQPHGPAPAERTFVFKGMRRNARCWRQGYSRESSVQRQVVWA